MMKTRSGCQKTFSSPEPKVKSHRSRTDRSVGNGERTRSLTLKKVVNSTPKTKTPKRDKNAVTPVRDDFILSQHFDSQAEVGWDCNSPNAIRGLQRLSGGGETGVSDLVMQLIRDEPEELSCPKRSTPPLLGIWRDAQGDDHLLEAEESAPQQRFKKRGRTRRKSGKDSAVSLDLLQKLSSVLDQNHDKSPETRNNDVQSRFSDGEDNEAMNTSCDLFLSEHPGKPADQCPTLQQGKLKVIKEEQETDIPITVKDEIETMEVDTYNKTKINDVVDELWDDEDDDLFDNSYIIKATQMPTENKVKLCSPIISMKRKLSTESIHPKTKCSRFTSKLRDETETDTNVHQAPPSSDVSHDSAGASKPSLMFRHGKVSSENNNFTSLQNKNNVPSANIMINSQKPPLGPVFTSHTKQTLPSSRSNSSCAPIPTTIRNTKCARNQTGSSAFSSVQSSTNLVTSCSSNKSSSVMYCTVKSGTASQNISGHVGTTKSDRDKNSTALARSGSFKKHNSFPGPVSSETTSGNSSCTYSRQRSMSGTMNRQHSNQTSSTVSKITTQPPVHISMALENVPTTLATATTSVSSHCPTMTKSSFYGSLASCNAKSNPKCSSLSDHLRSESTTQSVSGSRYTSASMSTTTATLVTTCCSAKSSILTTTSSSPVITIPTSSRSRPSLGSMDTSLSDELLCQLAEPDDSLDIDMEDLVMTKTNISTSKTYTAVSLFGTASTANTVVSHQRGNTVTKTGTTVTRSFNFKEKLRRNTHCDSTEVTSVVTKPIASAVVSVAVTRPKSSLSITTARPAQLHTVEKPAEPLVVRAPPIYSEDLFPSDDDDDLLGDGLSEPEILAMIDKAEYLATQQLKSSQQIRADKVHNYVEDALDHIDSELGHPSSQVDRLHGSQGSLLGSQGNSSQGKSSQGHSHSSQGSQGNSIECHGNMNSSQTLGSQVKYSQADIERKKQEALERRKRKMMKV